MELLVQEVMEWCESNGVKQVELANMLGVSKQLVTEWVKGRRFPLGEEVLAMQEFLRNKPRHALSSDRTRRRRLI